jgi:hypothetical protein
VIVAATAQGIVDIATGETIVTERNAVLFAGSRTNGWVLADDGRRLVHDGTTVATFDDVARVVHPIDDRTALVGFEGAHIARVSINGTVDALPSFDTVPGRDEWYNPASPGRPDVWTLASSGGDVYASVHVGGLWRSSDRGDTWENALDPEVDIHQVAADEDVVIAAAQRGFGWSTDHGRTWSWTTEGLHADYLQAVVMQDGEVFVGVSTGPFGRDAAIYRAAKPGERFERRAHGLPADLEAIAPHHLAIDGDELAAVPWDSPDVFVSRDRGKSWSTVTVTSAVRSLASV